MPLPHYYFQDQSVYRLVGYILFILRIWSNRPEQTVKYQIRRLRSWSLILAYIVWHASSLSTDSDEGLFKFQDKYSKDIYRIDMVCTQNFSSQGLVHQLFHIHLYITSVPFIHTHSTYFIFIITYIPIKVIFLRVMNTLSREGSLSKQIFVSFLQWSLL